MTHGASGLPREDVVQKPAAERIVNRICRFAMISFIVMVLSNHLVSLLAALYQVPQDLPPRWNLYAWLDTAYTVATLREAGVLGYFLFIVLCIIASMAWVVKKEGREAVSEIRCGDMLSESQNSIVVVFRLLFVYYFLVTVYWQAMACAGVDFALYPESNHTVSVREIFSLTSAAVYEEFYFRIFLLGVPLLAVAVMMFLAGHRKKVPSPRRFLLGGDLHLGVPAVVFLSISSVWFAVAHVQLSPWEPAMALLPPTLLAGLILGYLFLEKGIHMALFFHFVVNYLFMLGYMNNSGMVLSPVADILGFISTTAFYLVVVLGAVAGPYYFVYYLKNTALFLRAGAEEAGLIKGKGLEKMEEGPRHQ